MSTMNPLVRFSSLAFAIGEAVWTKYSSGCLRHLQLKACGVTTEFKDEYKVSGALNEDMFAIERGYIYFRESATIWVTGGAVVEGRCDFVDPGLEVIELKSVNSNNSKRQYIDEGKPSVQNIAQLTGYMLGNDVRQGRLIYSQRDGIGELLAERTYHLTITDDGDIFIDGKTSGWTVGDVAQHAYLQKKYLSSDVVAPAPVGTKFEGPCRFCEFRSVCVGTASGTDLQPFVDACRDVLTNKVVG
jgi:hypothetical protein